MIKSQVEFEELKKQLDQELLKKENLKTQISESQLEFEKLKIKLEEELLENENVKKTTKPSFSENQSSNKKVNFCCSV